MFRRLPDSAAAPVEIVIDGKPYVANRGDTVAAALLAVGYRSVRRSAVSGALRGPFCMMGVCFECLVTVDGVDNVQGCLMRIEDGMRIETGAGKRRIGA